MSDQHLPPANDDDEEDEEDSDDDDDSDSDEEEEDEEEEEPPQLKYTRLGVEPLKDHAGVQETASAMAVSGKFLVLGTHSGKVHILDNLGHLINSYTQHTATINDISVDWPGEFIAAGSNDGRVSVMGMYDHSVASHAFERPIKGVALDPMYGSNPARPLVAGGMGQTLHLITKSRFLRTTKVEALHTGEGKLHAVKWRKDLIAWANDAGIKIYDTVAEQRIARIENPEKSPRPDLFRCHLCFETDTTLIIAWGNWVRICVIKDRDAMERLVDPTLPARRGEITHSFDTEYFICGVAPFGPNLLLLTYDDPDLPVGSNGTAKKKKRRPAIAKGVAPRPDLRVCQRDGEEVTRDSLNARDHHKWFATDYRLEQNPQLNENIYYILSPLEIIIAKPCDDDDYVSWLLKRFRYGEALNCVRNLNCKKPEHSLQATGEMYLTHLVEIGDYKSAAFHFREILGTDARSWEKWISVLEQAGQLIWVVDQLPTGPSFKLSPTIYKVVLQYLIKADHKALLQRLRTWPPALYPVPEVTQSVLQALASVKPSARPSEIGSPDAHTALTLALAALYEHTGQNPRALKLYLDLRRSDVFDFIERHSLFDSVADQVCTFMELDQSRALRFLVDNVDRVPVEHVISQLAGKPEFEHRYLDRLFKSDSRRGASYHNRQVELYAEHEPEGLLPFLRSSETINWKAALQVCKAKNMIREQVFVMGRMGDTRTALKLIMTKLGDVKEAVAFIMEHRDDDLFDELINSCLKSAHLISDLLEHLASVEGAMSTIDPLVLIHKIPAGLHVPGLRDKLIKIIHNNTLTKVLKDGCCDALHKDLVMLEREAHVGHAQAIKVRPAVRCLVCSDTLKPRQGQQDKASNLLVFSCGHAYHIGCYQQQVLTLISAKPRPPDIRGLERWDVRDFMTSSGLKASCLQCSTLRKLKPKKAGE